MARSRNIKPGFFTNPELLELDFAVRLLFAGLWTIADRAGRLEDRPKKIKLDIFPGDTLDIDSMLEALEHAGFIVRYEANGLKLIQIITWEKHQNPHSKEAPSTYPEPGKPGASPVPEPEEGCLEGVLAGLIPSSLIPDSLDSDSLVAPDAAKPTRSKPRTKLPEDFEPNDAGVQLCSSAGFVLSEELQKFRNHHNAQGSTMADWQAAWRTWIDKAKQFRKVPARASPYQSHRAARMAEAVPGLAAGTTRDFIDSEARDVDTTLLG